MKYVESGYKEIKPGVYMKTYEPYEDGTVATEKQKTAIKNLRSYQECGVKTKHSSLSKREISRIEKLTKVQAMLEISQLIKDVEDRDNEMNSWEIPF